jgi:hypothetical protein
MKQIKIFDRAGAFAENKDVAKEIRIKEIIPALNDQEEVILDFNGVDAATQSFVHALISDALRKHGNEILDKLIFKGCNDTIREIVSIVTDYMQD